MRNVKELDLPFRRSGGRTPAQGWAQADGIRRPLSPLIPPSKRDVVGRHPERVVVHDVKASCARSAQCHSPALRRHRCVGAPRDLGV